MFETTLFSETKRVGCYDLQLQGLLACGYKEKKTEMDSII